MASGDDAWTNQRRSGVWRAFLIALRHSGARPGTIAAVTASHVSPAGDAWIIKKHKTVQKTQQPLVVWLHPCLGTLTRILQHFRPTGPLFVNANGEAWTRNAIRLRMARLRKKLGLPQSIVAYSYRHGYAQRALLSGNDIATVAELMGHRDISMIARHYGHLDQARDHLKKAVAKVV